MVEENRKLKKYLTPTKLWAICVGAVISGMYYGWNYGFASTNFIGMLIAYGIVTIFYTTFIFCYSELATAIPSSAGPAAYSEKAFGRFPGFIAGFSIVVEYLFAAPGVSISVGAYIHLLVPEIPTVVASIVCYLIFVFINCRGIEAAATIELIVTIIAIVGLLIYFFAGFPYISTTNLFSSSQSLNGLGGILAAVPYAVWFYLAVESGAMGAEECRNPKKDMPKAFIGAVLTLSVLTVMILIVTAGIANSSTITSSDSPLPTALAAVMGQNNPIIVILGIIGLFGLIASLQGVIIGYSRQGYTMARNNFLPKYIARLDKNGTPVRALICMSAIGIICVLFGNVAAIVCISSMGSALMSIICILALFKLRRTHPKMERPYKVAYPIIPIIALVTDIFVIVGVVVSILNQGKLIYAVIAAYAIGILYYFLWCRNKKSHYDEEMVASEIVD